MTQTGLPLALSRCIRDTFGAGLLCGARRGTAGSEEGASLRNPRAEPRDEPRKGFPGAGGALFPLWAPVAARRLTELLPPPFFFPFRTDQGQVAFGGHFMAEGEGYFAMAEDELAGGPYMPLGCDFSGGSDVVGGCGFDEPGSDYGDSPTAHCNVLNWEQVQRLDGILSETIPIHGRGNFPTLELQPSLIVKVVRRRLADRSICVRDVRLNGSAASHVLHQDSGLGYKDLDLIFCADLRGEEEFQTVKDVVLDCLLDFLPEGVNKEKITPLTLKVKSPDRGLGSAPGGAGGRGSKGPGGKKMPEIYGRDRSGCAYLFCF